MEQPVYYWDPSIAPSGAAFYSGDLIPEWRGSLFVSGLGSKQLQRLTVNQKGMVVGRPESLLGQLGLRFRDIRQAPDGALYVLTEGRPSGTDDVDGAVLRIEAAPEVTGP